MYVLNSTSTTLDQDSIEYMVHSKINSFSPLLKVHQTSMGKSQGAMNPIGAIWFKSAKKYFHYKTWFNIQCMDKSTDQRFECAVGYNLHWCRIGFWPTCPWCLIDELMWLLALKVMGNYFSGPRELFTMPTQAVVLILVVKHCAYTLQSAKQWPVICRHFSRIAPSMAVYILGTGFWAGLPVPEQTKI